MTAIVGYRLDMVRSSGCVGWYGAPNTRADDPTGRYRAAEDRYIWTPSAVCLLDRYHFHGAPDPDCECGWRIVTDPRELHPDAHGNARSRGSWAWKERGVLASAGVGVGADGRVGGELIAKRGAIVEVASVGRCFQIDDTTSSWAAGRLERIDVHVLADRTGRALAERVQRFYGPDEVTIHRNINACLRALGRARRDHPTAD